VGIDAGGVTGTDGAVVAEAVDAGGGVGTEGAGAGSTTSGAGTVGGTTGLASDFCGATSEVIADTTGLGASAIHEAWWARGGTGSEELTGAANRLPETMVQIDGVGGVGRRGADGRTRVPGSPRSPARKPEKLENSPLV